MLTHIFTKNFASTNEVINVNRRNKYSGAKLKKKETNIVDNLVKDLIKYEEYPVWVGLLLEFTRSNCDFDGGWLAIKPLLDGCKEVRPSKKRKAKYGILYDDSISYIGDDACIKYIKSGRKCCHLIISDVSSDEVRAYLEDLKKEFEKDVDTFKNITYHKNMSKQIVH